MRFIASFKPLLMKSYLKITIKVANAAKSALETLSRSGRICDERNSSCFGSKTLHQNRERANKFVPFWRRMGRTGGISICKEVS